MKKQDNEGPSSATPTPPSAGKKQGKEKQDKKRRDRKKEVVTSASVFSMGPAEKLTDRREGNDDNILNYSCSASTYHFHNSSGFSSFCKSVCSSISTQ